MLKILAKAIRQEKEKKTWSYTDWEEKIKLSLFADYMIISVENLKKFDKKFLWLISDYSKLTGYKVNMQKPIDFLYTSNKQVKFAFKNALTFILLLSKWNTWV